jgi:hypothetical protein
MPDTGGVSPADRHARRTLYRHPAEWPWEYVLAVQAAGVSLGLDSLLKLRSRTGVLT